MTSEERREGRRKRRIENRLHRKLKYLKQYDDLLKVTDLNNLVKAAYQSRKGTNKKASVQKYIINLMRNSIRSSIQIANHNDIRQGFIEFTLNERGKKRNIRAMHIKERVIQRCLCDNVLVPALKYSLVYDNGASIKGKGIHFAISRLKNMLVKYVRKHGPKGYILLTDFSGYFDNIRHLPIWFILMDKFQDPELRLFIWKFIKAFGDKSLGIGSQVSQILAIAYPNKVDHRIKECHKNGLSARYNDDCYAISEDKAELKKLLDDCSRLWSDLGIFLNSIKTRIMNIQNFTFMKVRFRITDSGKILMLPCKKSFTRMRRKLRAFRRYLENGEMTFSQINCCYQSWYGYQLFFNARQRLRNMDLYFFKIIGIWPEHRQRRARR